MKISDDQNTIEWNGVKGEFVSSIGKGCDCCCFYRALLTVKSCLLESHAYCVASERLDCREGYFKLVEGEECVDLQ